MALDPVVPDEYVPLLSHRGDRLTNSNIRSIPPNRHFRPTRNESYSPLASESQETKDGKGDAGWWKIYSQERG